MAARCETEAFQYHLCSIYRGLWGLVIVQLSCYCSSVAEHWLHKPGVLGSIQAATAGDSLTDVSGYYQMVVR